jgi:hypothetical protein
MNHNDHLNLNDRQQASTGASLLLAECTGAYIRPLLGSTQPFFTLKSTETTSRVVQKVLT